MVSRCNTGVTDQLQTGTLTKGRDARERHEHTLKLVPFALPIDGRLILRRLIRGKVCICNTTISLGLTLKVQLG